MTVATYKWTIDRYHQAIATGVLDNEAIELLRGELIVMPPEGEPHAYYNSEVGDYLRRLLGNRAKIREAHPITLDQDSEPVPDLAIVKPLGATYLKHHPYPDDIFWLIEFSKTTLNQDLTIKREIYAKAGILEYWVIDLNHQELTIFRDWDNGNYNTHITYRTGMVSPVQFPTLEISVQRLLNP